MKITLNVWPQPRRRGCPRRSRSEAAPGPPRPAAFLRALASVLQPASNSAAAISVVTSRTIMAAPSAAVPCRTIPRLVGSRRGRGADAPCGRRCRTPRRSGSTSWSPRPTRFRGRMAWEERLTTAGLLHGGVLMGLADAVGAYCAFLNLPEGSTSTATIESKTNSSQRCAANGRGALAAAASRQPHGRRRDGPLRRERQARRARDADAGGARRASASCSWSPCPWAAAPAGTTRPRTRSLSPRPPPSRSQRRRRP